jgi:hypothetical protein
MATREEMMHVAALAGERDGFLARAQQLAGEVRKTSISLHTSEKATAGAVEAARKAIDEATRLRSVLRAIRDAGALNHAPDLAQRVAEALE